MNIKKDFPIFKNRDLVYLDNAATTQKPQQVIDAIKNLYECNYASIHRSTYRLAEELTEKFESVRSQVANFIGAQKDEIILTSSATDAINLVGFSWAQHNLKKGSKILISQMEHHANLIVWQELATKNEWHLNFIPITHDGNLNHDVYVEQIKHGADFVALSHSSNVFGTIIDVEFFINLAHNYGAKILIDGSQAAPRVKLNLNESNPDFYVFSPHKMHAPTGLGILYINKEIHDQIYPHKFGGFMVYESGFEKSTYKKVPYGLEAGTPNIEGVIGFGATLEYINNNINFDALRVHEASLCKKLIEALQQFDNVQILGPIEQLKKAGHLVSFAIKDIHPHDISAYLDEFNIAVRAGHHCAQPLHKLLNLSSSIRVSFYAYNDHEDVEKLICALTQFLK